MSAGARSAPARRRRACRRCERTIWWQNALAPISNAQPAVAQVRPSGRPGPRGRATARRARRRTAWAGGRSGEVVLAEERVARQPHGPGRAARRTYHAVGRGTGRAPARSASCSGSGAHVAEKRASKSWATTVGSRTTIAGPHSLFSDRCSAGPGRRRRPRVEADHLAPGVHAGVGAPGAGQLHRLAEHPPSASRSTPATVRTPGCAAKPWNRRRRTRRRAGRAPSGLDREPRVDRAGVEERHRPGPRCSDQLDARHRGVVAVAGAELEDAGVAAVAVGVARADLVEQLGGDLLVAEVRRRPGGGGGGRPSWPW